MQNYKPNIHQHDDEVPMAEGRNKTNTKHTGNLRVCASIFAVEKQ
jgi:hypothetical protein